MTLLLASYTGLETRLTEMLIGRNISGYTASRYGRIFDEVKGKLYVSRSNFWLRNAQPFALCTDLVPFYGGQPSDVRLLAIPDGVEKISLLTWSRDLPDRVIILKFKTTFKSETTSYDILSFRLRIKDGEIVKKDTHYTSDVVRNEMKCTREGSKILYLGRSLKSPTFIWTGKGIWVTDDGILYAYRESGLAKLRDFKEDVFPASNGEGLVALYVPRKDELVIYDQTSVKELKGISKEVKGSFSSIHTIREYKKGKLGKWVIVLIFREGSKSSYVRIKKEKGIYTLESTEL